ncbi:zinc finger domain-containing protein [Amycolatopsis thermophila]|uniref:zinc finger domain-containing protein n=1 Tax=Amycolatopsis thermophila TaxID=206084 RepID=UPI003522A0E7
MADHPGSSHDEPDRPTPCSECRGQGEVRTVRRSAQWGVSIRTERCTRCKGTGVEPDNEVS